VRLLVRLFSGFRRRDGKKIRIAVLGNCQARPLAALLPLANPAIEVIYQGVVHLLRDDDAPQCEAAFREADLILAQRVSDTYPCVFARSSCLLDNFGQKVLFWPNLYFRGYNPELFYIRLDDRTPLRGPLGDYQSKTYFEGWRRGLSAQETLALHLDMDFNHERYAAVPEASLAELRRREQETHVRITPELERLVWTQRLFFTFNHPCLFLLQLTAAALLQEAGIPAARFPRNAGPEPLGLIRLPLNPWVARDRGMQEPQPDRWTGLAVRDIQKNLVAVGGQREYSSSELVASFFKIYAANQDLLLTRNADGEA
jgi:hypothetical protein